MTITGILIRFACLIALMEGTAYGLGLLSGGKGDANIGAGVMAFFALLVASGAWAFMDGRKHQSVGRLMVSWFVVAMLVGVAAVIVISLTESDFEMEVLRSDLVSVSPFIAGIVAVPAAIGILVGSASSRDQA